MISILQCQCPYNIHVKNKGSSLNSNIRPVRSCLVVGHLTWLFFSSSSNCLIRVLDQAFVCRNLASDLLASSVFCFVWAAWNEEGGNVDEMTTFTAEKIHLCIYNRYYLLIFLSGSFYLQSRTLNQMKTTKYVNLKLWTSTTMKCPLWQWD